MKDRSLSAKKLIQLLWKPEIGDRVYFRSENQKNWEKGSITNILESGEFCINYSGKKYTTGEVRYRAIPEDYETVVKGLKDSFLYLETTSSSGHLIGSLPVGKNKIILKGRPRKILIGILELRGMCYSVNNAVNRLLSDLRVISRKGKPTNVIPIKKGSTP